MRTRTRFTPQRVKRWLSAVVIAALIGSFSALGAAPAFAEGSGAALGSDGLNGVELDETAMSAGPVDPAGGDAATEAGDQDAAQPTEASDAIEPAPTSEAPVMAPTNQAPAAAPRAATATPTIEVTAAPHNGGVVTVSGTGFLASAPGVYLGVGPAGLAGFYQGSSSMIASETVWISVDNVDGASETGKTAQMSADGSFEFTVTVPRPTETSPAFALYTSKAHGQGFGDPSQNTITPIVFAPDSAAAPAVTVSKTTGINPAGEYVTVTGTGFVQNAATTGTRPPLAGKFTGSYVVFGRFADVWQPTAGAAGSSRVAGDTKWAVLAADMATVGGPDKGAIELRPDGSFETQIWVTQDFTGVPETGNFGVYTYPGGGAKFAPFETYMPITFAVPVVSTTTTVSTSTRGPVALGATVTLTARVSPAAASGAVQFFTADTVLGSPVALNAQGKASLETALNTAGSAALSARFIPDAGSSFAASTSSTIVITVQAPPAVPGGTLTWGVDNGFRAYVTGGIAQGSIALSGGATTLGGVYHFGQGSSSFDRATGTGSAGYVGAVRFRGHNGALDLRFSRPTVRVDSPSSGALLVTVNGNPVTLATLNLAAAARSGIDGATSYTDVPALLTSAGSAAFEGFYGAGHVLSPVSFTIGSASEAPAGASGTVSTASAPAAAARPIPALPPATSGVTVTPDMLKLLLAGKQATVTADGFAPNETGIRVVVYSTPTVLAENVTANADGVASWTGSLPVGLTGTHTLTFQGSVDRGIVLEIPASLAAGFCSVDGAELSWGLKERFRDYVLGGIANGDIEMAGGATETDGGFAWASGTGEFSAETTRGLVSLNGSVRFTGHAGVLNTAIANPRIEIENADRAYLLLDVTGTTQQGEAINSIGVRFAEVTLTGASSVVDGAFMVTDAAAVLTEQGTASFGTYPAGEQLDPVSFVIPLPADCGTVAPAANSKPAAGANIAEAVTAVPDANLDWLGWFAAALVLLAAIAATVVLLVRRRASGRTTS